MYEAAKMLNIGMIVFFLVTAVSAVLLIFIHRNRMIKQETRIKLGKSLSLTPFVFNLGLLIAFLCISFLQFVISTDYIMIALFVILYGSGFSAVTGGAVALFGLYFSVGYIKASKKYVVFSIISMVISLLFLVIYLIVLTPLWMKYYGL